MSEDSHLRDRDNGDDFKSIILSHLCHKYLYLCGFLLSASTLIIVDLNQYIDLHL